MVDQGSARRTRRERRRRPEKGPWERWSVTRQLVMGVLQDLSVNLAIANALLPATAAKAPATVGFFF